MQILLNLFIFSFGLIIGSFLNSVIYRLKFGGSVWFGRSKCPHCRHILGFWDLIPVLSFIFLHGKCRFCHRKISIQYPLVEIITAFLFLLVFNFQFTISNKIPPFLPLLKGGGEGFIYFCYLLFVICCLIIIFVYDLKYRLILDKVLLSAAIISAIFYIVLFFINKDFFDFYSLIFGLLIGGGLFLLMYLVSKGKWIGAGDVKFGFLIGLWLLYPKILIALFFAFVLGGIVGLVLIFAGKKKMKSQIPFGPFLVAGVLSALFFGQEILDWYLGWLRVY